MNCNIDVYAAALIKVQGFRRLTPCRLANTDASVELAAPVFVVQEAPEGISLQEVDIMQGHDMNHIMMHLVQSNLFNLLRYAVNS